MAPDGGRMDVAWYCFNRCQFVAKQKLRLKNQDNISERTAQVEELKRNVSYLMLYRVKRNEC